MFNDLFFPLHLLANTSTYYGPLEYTVQLTNKSNTLNTTFSSTFNFFSDPIPNTIDQIIHTWPGIKDLVAKLDIYDDVTFTVSIGCWTTNNGHLATFENDEQKEFYKSRFGKTFRNIQVIGVRELKKQYNIVDERDANVKTCVENLTKQFKSNKSQEYLIVELINKELDSDVVSNYSIGYKGLFKNINLDSDFQTLKINFIITDYYNLTKTSNLDLGSNYILEIKLANNLPNDIDGLLAQSSNLYVRVPDYDSENFVKYLQLVEKLKNWSKYNQVDTFAKEILNSKSESYVKYVNKILGCECKINNSILNMEYVEPMGFSLDLINESVFEPYDTNDQLKESFY